MNDEARSNLEPIEKMVDGLGVDAVFGEPIREGGVTVVPVARCGSPSATGMVRGGVVAKRPKAGRARQKKAAGVAVAQAAGPLPKATFASLPMTSGSNPCWMSHALRWPASPRGLERLLDRQDDARCW
jgi:hypothetical protein